MKSEFVQKLIDNYLQEKGFLLSLEKNICVDKDGNYIPWYNYQAVDFIQERIPQSAEIFEYGSGTSTLFYSKRTKQVCTLEYRKEWFDYIRVFNLPNVDLRLCENLELYPSAIENFAREFDVIVVDSEKRVECIKSSIHFLKKDGVIILDNSERKSYTQAFDFLHKMNFKSINLKGIGSLRFKESQTTIFYKKDNVFSI